MSSFCDRCVTGECPACINGQCGYVLDAETDLVLEALAKDICLYELMKKRRVMLDLKKYSIDQLYAMQDLLDHLAERLDEYVTLDFIRITGMQDVVDHIVIEIDGRMEDMENEEK